MNSDVDLFVMKKLLKSGICKSVNSAQMHYSRWKSQHLRLLFNEQCINSSRITPKRVKTKPKKKKNETCSNKRRRSFSPIQTGTNVTKLAIKCYYNS